MALIPWEPLKEFEKFFEEELEFIPVLPFRAPRIPEADVYETDKEVVVEMPLAGVKPEDVEISVKDNLLTVKGETKEEKEEKKKNYFKKEIKRGRFERTLSLPTEVKAEKATAESINGILKIVLPKVKVTKPKVIKVKVKK